MLTTLRISFKQALKIWWMMMKIYIPISFLTALLKQLGVITLIAPNFSPLMKYVGLPGEAAVTMIAGGLNTLYAAIATLGSLSLNFRQMTILGVMVGIAHSLIIETAILKKMKVATVRIFLFRIVTAFVVGFLMNLFLPDHIHGTLLKTANTEALFSWTGFVQTQAKTITKIFVLIFVLFFVYELLKASPTAQKIKTKLSLTSQWLGLSPSAFGPLLVGLFVGLLYGAGILMQMGQNRAVTHKDLTLVALFLCLAHAIIEDTMLFVVFGGNFWWIIITRMVIAIGVIRLLAFKDLYKKFWWIGLTKERPEPQPSLQ